MGEKNNKIPLNEDFLKEINGGNGANPSDWKCSSCGNKKVRIISSEINCRSEVEVECLSCGTKDWLNVIAAFAFLGEPFSGHDKK